QSCAKSPGRPRRLAPRIPAMSELLSATVSHLNRLRRRAYLGVAAIRFARATFLAGTMLGIWSFIRPEDRLGQAILTLLTFLVGMSFNSERHSKPIRDEDILLALEMTHPKTRHSPFALRDEHISPQVAE